MQPRYVIVCGLEFSPNGDDALRESLRLARARSRSELHVVHVATRGETEQAPGVTEIERQSSLLASLPERVWKRIRLVAFEPTAEHTPVHVFVHVRLGGPAEAIHQTAVDYVADLVVVGTHGRTGFEKLVLGSTSAKLLALARCPLLVVRPRDYAGCAKSDRVEPARPDQPRRTGPPIRTHVHTSSEIVSWGHHDSNVVPTGISM